VYRVRRLTLTLWLTLGTLALGAVLSAAAGYRARVGTSLALLPVLLAVAFARRGRPRLATALLVATMLGLETWLLYVGWGLHDLALILYPVVVLVAGLLLDRRLFLAVVALSLASLGFVAWAQHAGRVSVLSETFREGLPMDVAIVSLVLCAAAAIVRLVSDDLSRRLRKAQLSEERYRLISEVSSDYTFSSVVDPDGRVRQDWVAGAFETMTGYSFEEYQARGGWRAALHPGDRAQDDRDLEELRANRPVTTELRTITREGAVRWVRVYGHPVWSDAERRLVGIYGAVQDITERKQAEAEREALIAQLEAKNAELERFTYTVSHDLKSPLVTVRGFLGFLEQDAREGNVERLRNDVERIRQATDKMRRLMDELLELSRVGRAVNPPEPVPLGELAREAVALVAGQVAERGVAVEIAPDLPVVLGDRPRLRQVLQNLVENAVKFLGDQARPRLEIGVRPTEAGPVLFVKDNGIGIDPRYHDRVFGLFEKLAPDSLGTGVGLALVRRIVELHEGRVWVESEGRGRGSTFCFTLGAGPAQGPPAEA
jgi:PAS domain S-box-containing protein